MSQKISEYFKVTPKGLKSDKKSLTSVELPKVRDCFVVLKDFNEKFVNKLKLFEEISLDDDMKYHRKTCKFCGKNFVSAKTLFKHTRQFHSETLLSCSVCSLKFQMQKCLDSHIKKKHSKLEQFECDFDGKIFKTKRLLNCHMQGHLPLIECKICKKILKTVSMNAHLRDFHANGKQFNCKICKKKFRSRQLLNYHEKIHDKKYKCEICEKKFENNYRLKNHSRFYHENKKSFECETCKKKFNQKAYLKNHQKIHYKNRPKPYKCQQCDYSTDIMQAFNKHQKFHERQDKKFAAMKNPIKCEKCQAFFKNDSALRSHMLYVHTNVLYQCDLCAKFIKSKKNLTIHMKFHIRNF